MPSAGQTAVPGASVPPFVEGHDMLHSSGAILHPMSGSARSRAIMAGRTPIRPLPSHRRRDLVMARVRDGLHSGSGETGPSGSSRIGMFPRCFLRHSDVKQSQWGLFAPCGRVACQQTQKVLLHRIPKVDIEIRSRFGQMALGGTPTPQHDRRSGCHPSRGLGLPDVHVHMHGFRPMLAEAGREHPPTCF